MFRLCFFNPYSERLECEIFISITPKASKCLFFAKIYLEPKKKKHIFKRSYLFYYDWGAQTPDLPTHL